ncbi:MAG: sugar diacid recognition domain-containing protein [Clostridia bacterium]
MMEESNRRSPIVISREIATKIVDHAKGTIKYNINIMNERGIVIASSDFTRVGKFHEIAYQIITGTEDALETENSDELLGTKPGINTVLKYLNDRVGVLGITGNPDEVRPFVSVLKLAVESMIDFEGQQQRNMLHFSLHHLLEAGLMYGTNSDADLAKWAMELKLDRSIDRIPLYVHVKGEAAPSLMHCVQEELLASPHATQQDIITQWEAGGFVIFKAFDEGEAVMESYRQIITEYLEDAFCCMRAAGLVAQAFSGSFCKHLRSYHEAYKRAVWLYETCNETKQEYSFFYDFMNEWIYSFLPMKELKDVFRFFVAKSDEKFIENMVRTEKALAECNYNGTLASQKLYVHKNTLFLWLNNYRRYYHMDPVQKPADRAFWECLCFYLKQRS